MYHPRLWMAYPQKIKIRWILLEDTALLPSESPLLNQKT